jgi:predicted ribosome quality control (RQC) complex YloA/Tae2 family protein
MRELYTLELIELAKELKSIEGLYLDQFYETERNRFRFKLSKRGEKYNLQCILPYTINRTDLIEVKESTTNFALAVRKRISGAKIKSVLQLNNDRIISIKLEKATEESFIILEMFGKGNMIFTDANMKIQLAYLVHDFKDRAVRPGETYKPPNNTSLDISTSGSIDTIQKEITYASKEATIVNYVAKKVGLGTMYLREAAARSEIKPDAKIKELDSESTNMMFSNIKEIVKDCIGNPKPTAYQKDGAIANFALCSITEYEGYDSKEFESLEMCLDFVYQNVELTKAEKNEEEEKILASIEKQKHILKGITKEIDENKEIGDYVMNHMHELNTIINAVKSNKNATREDLQKLTNEIEILNMSMKTKSIRIKPKDDS